MPEELFEKLVKARTFNQGLATLEYIESCLLDMAWHTLAPGAQIAEIASFETEILKRHNVFMPLIPPRYRSTYFSHIWQLAYAAGYYSYMWERID